MAQEAILRALAFAGVLGLMLAWEWWAPLRPDVRRWQRRGVNLGLVVVDTLLVRLSVPLLATGAALLASQHSLGLLHQVAWPAWLEFTLALLVLDLAIYWQHRLFHRVGLLWRLHAVHHSDVALDATSGLRFHPLEIVLSMAIKMAVVLLLGAPVAAVILFEILLNATSLFNHGNVELPGAWDRRLRRWIVTPAMHRVHHSVRSDEHHHNFGFNLSLWDYVFGSYLDQPQAGHLGMTLGLERYRECTEQGLWPLLLQPFRREPPPP